MTATSINIDNTLIAIKTGVIPGCFTPDYKGFIFPTLRYTNEKNALLEWIISIKLKKGDKYVAITESMLDKGYRFDETYVACIEVDSKQVGGEIRKSVPTMVKTGKNINKKNETNVLTQAFRDSLSLYNKQSNKTSIGKSDDRPPPMLLQWAGIGTLKNVLPENITIQRKFNGVRYVTFLNIDGDVVQYSRTGTTYYPSNYLIDSLKKILINVPKLKKNKYGIADDKELEIYSISKPYLDGELYSHGKSLNYISGQARKMDDNSKIDYCVFDIFFPLAISNGYNMKSINRQEYLSDMFKQNAGIYNIKRVENFTINSIKEISKLTDIFVEEGYEGSVIRKNNCTYKYSFNGYHSLNVLKLKPIYSEEFKVVGFTCGKKGKDFGKILWICEVNNVVDDGDKIFTVVPNLPLKDRESLFKCLESDGKLFNKYVKNSPITIEYSEISQKTGKPLQAKAIAFRTYEDSNDNIKNLYKLCGIV